MPKALRHFLLALFLAAMQGVAQAERIELPGASHDVDGARWTDTLVQDLNDQCATLQPAKPAPAYCGNFWVRVSNQSDDVLQCRVTLGLSGDKGAGNWVGDRDLVVEPGRDNSTYAVKGPDSLSPVSFSTHCSRVPKQAVPMDGSTACPVEAAIDNPDDFYPPGSIRRRESGEAIIEFAVDTGVWAKDIRLVQTSGFGDLDSAALKVGRALRVNAQCAGQRVRRSVLFDISSDPRDERESLGCLVYNPPAMVLISDPGAK